MRYTGIQPQYFPRLHYFARILNTDSFVIRNDAQFVSKHRYPDGRVDKSYQAHTPIKQSFGIHLLSVPVKHEGFKKISETKISYDQDWIESHLKTLNFSYAKARNLSQILKEVGDLLTQKFATLDQLNTATILWALLRLLGIEKVSANMLSVEFVEQELSKQNTFRLRRIRRADEIGVVKENMNPNEKIVALCKFVGANEDFCGGTGATAYMSKGIFEKNGIKITVQDWKCQAYPQLFEKQLGFIPNLSIIDLLMNTTHSEAVKIIQG